MKTTEAQEVEKVLKNLEKEWGKINSSDFRHQTWPSGSVPHQIRGEKLIVVVEQLSEVDYGGGAETGKEQYNEVRVIDLSSGDSKQTQKLTFLGYRGIDESQRITSILGFSENTVKLEFGDGQTKDLLLQ